MAVNYTLRNPNHSIATEPDQREAEDALVKPFVVLKADPGSGAQLVDQIRDFASSPFPDPKRFDRLCEGWKVTGRYKKALRDLFNDLRLDRITLKLDDPATNVPWDVNPP